MCFVDVCKKNKCSKALIDSGHGAETERHVVRC